MAILMMYSSFRIGLPRSVAALEVQLTLGEQARVWRKRSGSPLAYEHYLKARNYYLNFSKHTHAPGERRI